MKEFSSYVFSPLREGDIALYGGSGNGLTPILLAAAPRGPGVIWPHRPVPLGGYDESDRLLIPEKLYGREREIEALLAAFDRAVPTAHQNSCSCLAADWSI